MRIQESYRSRSIRYLELWRLGGWRLKVYGISYDSGIPSAGLVADARDLARHELQADHAVMASHSVGFLGVHAGRDANVVFASWWCNENELRHRVWSSPLSSPAVFTARAADGFIGCVWDIALIAFERTAWLQSVLRPEIPDLDAYLSTTLTADV